MNVKALIQFARFSSRKFEKANGKKGNVPFRRVKSDEILINRRLSDNSFEAKRGAAGSWGEKAHRDLKHTQGKSFKREKGKKKKGQYRGGSIDTSVNSVKFDSDSD